jgi:hypothetical protein
MPLLFLPKPMICPILLSDQLHTDQTVSQQDTKMFDNLNGQQSAIKLDKIIIAQYSYDQDCVFSKSRDRYWYTHNNLTSILTPHTSSVVSARNKSFHKNLKMLIF